MEFEELKKCVSELLYKHNCVIIPGFGGFITNFKPAGFEDSRLFICPPRNRVAFNQNLNQNDGLLCNHWAKQKGTDYATASREVEAFTQHLKEKITHTKSYDFKDLGTFYLNHEHNPVFLPFQGLNFLESGYGLEPVKIKLLPVVPLGLQIQRQTKVATGTEGGVSESLHTGTRNKAAGMHPFLYRLAAGVALVLLSTALFYGIKNNPFPLSHKEKDPSEQTAALLHPDSNSNHAASKGSNAQNNTETLIVPEYSSEKEQLYAIKARLKQLNKDAALQNESFEVIAGYYATEQEARTDWVRLKKRFEHPVISQNSDGMYFIHIETFFKHTSAEDFSVMLQTSGHANIQVLTNQAQDLP